MTPKEFLVARVLTENPVEYKRYERYVSEYPGMRIETKHETGALIAKIRLAHEQCNRTDWLELISDLGGSFIVSCLDADSPNVADEYTSKSLLFAFGGFENPHEDLVDAVAEIAGAIEYKISSLSDSELKQNISPRTFALKKHAEILRKTIRQTIPTVTPTMEVEVDSLTTENSWQKWPISDLETHLSAAAFPSSRLIDFQSFFVSFMADPHKQTKQPVKSNSSSSQKCVVNSIQYGIIDNPYAGTGWQPGANVDSDCSTTEFKYPKAIRVQNGISRIHEVLFPEDARFYNIQLPRFASSRPMPVSPLVPTSFPPVVESMALRDLESAVEIADDVISALETIRASPWTTPVMSKKLSDKLQREKLKKQEIEAQASADYEQTVFRGTMYVESLKLSAKTQNRKATKANTQGC